MLFLLLRVEGVGFVAGDVAVGLGHKGEDLVEEGESLIGEPLHCLMVARHH